MDRIKWCLKQKSGLELVEPNRNLVGAYLQKAENSLKAAATLKDNLEWEVSSSYYAMYFSLYAILMRIGIKSEIHSCTLAFMKEFLSEYFSEEDIYLIENAQRARIDVQYYSDRIVSDSFLTQIRSNRALFLIKCKSVLNKISEQIIKKIRNELTAIV